MKVLKSVGTLENLNQFLKRGKKVYQIIKNIDLNHLNMTGENKELETYNIIYDDTPIRIFLLSPAMHTYLRNMSELDLILWSEELDGLFIQKPFSEIKEYVETQVFENKRKEVYQLLEELKIKETEET